MTAGAGPSSGEPMMSDVTLVAARETAIYYLGLGLASAFYVGIWFAFDDLRQIVREAAPAPRGRR